MTWELLEKGDAWTVTGDGVRVIISPDTFPESPREWSNVFSIETWTREWISPDRSDFLSLDRFLDWWHGDCQNCGDAFTNHDYDGADTFATTGDAPADDPDAALFFVEHNYHTGAVSKCDQNRADGVAYVTGDVARCELLPAGADVHAILRGELESFGQYAGGDVWTIIWERWTGCDDCGRGEWEHVGAVGGYFGLSYAIHSLSDDAPAGVETSDVLAAFPSYLVNQGVAR